MASKDPMGEIKTAVDAYLRSREPTDRAMFAEVLTGMHKIACQHSVEVLKDGGPVLGATWVLLMSYLSGYYDSMIYDTVIDVATEHEPEPQQANPVLAHCDSQGWSALPEVIRMDDES